MTKMDFKEKMEQIKANYTPDAFLPKARKGLICPKCGNGSGKTGTGLWTTDNRHYRCFSERCHGASYDIFDLWKLHRGISGNTEALKELCSFLNVSMEDVQLASSYSQRQSSYKTSVSFVAYEGGKVSPDNSSHTETYTSFYEECHSRINGKPNLGREYANSRGITQELIDRFNIGYAPRWRHPKAPDTVWKTPHLIIPINKHCYFSRAIRADANQKYSKQRVTGKNGIYKIFNADALWKSDKPVFICEGEIDALSFLSVGQSAISTAGVAGVHELIGVLEKWKPTQPLILAYDADQSGTEAELELSGALTQMGIIHQRLRELCWQFYRNKKDINAILQLDLNNKCEPFKTDAKMTIYRMLEVAQMLEIREYGDTFPPLIGNNRPTNEEEEVY